MTDHLARLAGDPPLRERLGASGKGRAEALFSRDEMNRKYLGLYAEMIGAH
jgi:glycosyltransferase involved in cell wall biosynthesis